VDTNLPQTSSPAPRRSLAWLLSGRVLQLAVGFAMGVLIARYLGPEELGVFGVAAAFAGLFSPLVGIGAQIIVRDLSVPGAEPRRVLASSALVVTVTGLVTLVASLATAAVIYRDDATTMVLIAILSLPLLLAPLRVAEYWFESSLDARRLTIARSVGLGFGTMIRIGTIAFGLGVEALAVAVVVEQAVGAAVVAAAFRRAGPGSGTWAVSTEHIRAFTRESLPALVAAVAVTVYMRIDQVMLGWLSTDREAGLYAAVVRLSEAFYFVPIAVAATIAPMLAQLRALGDRSGYLRQLERMTAGLVGLALLIAIPLIVLSPLIIDALLGSAFDGAGIVLAIHAGSLLFVFLGVAQSVWTTNESLQTLGMWRAVAGAVVNVGLNLLLIPEMGAAGASWATLISYAISSWLGNLAHPATRPVFWMQQRAMRPKAFISVLAAESRRHRRPAS
jgi:polysaccharide transporter, PST family